MADIQTRQKTDKGCKADEGQGVSWSAWINVVPRQTRPGQAGQELYAIQW